VAASADDAERFELTAEHAWLAAHRPAPPVDPVVCHGNLQPSQIRLDPAEPEHAVVTTWTQVTVDARERDVAQTSLALWSIPHVARRRSERMMLKMFRDTLVANYRDGYAAEAGVDLDAALLAWWRAAHVLDWSIRLARSQQADEPDPWDPVHLVAKPQSFARDLRAHFWALSQEAES
jgi:aminoglycoside phosphotransferase (APT) family kinase protein